MASTTPTRHKKEHDTTSPALFSRVIVNASSRSPFRPTPVPVVPAGAASSESHLPLPPELFTTTFPTDDIPPNVVAE
jgi:hypothetical protein